MGTDKTLHRVSQHFFWPRMRSTVHRYIRTCVSCQHVKCNTLAPMGLLQPLPIPDSRFDTWSMDFAFGLPLTKNKKDMLVLQCSITKILIIIPCKTTITAPQVAQLCFDALVSKYGVPRVFISDRDSKFTSHFWKCLWDLLETKLTMSTARHPQTNGQTERANRTIIDMLKAFAWAHPKAWDTKLTSFEMAYNSSEHHTTGFAHFVLAYGQNINTPLSLLWKTECVLLLCRQY